MLLVSQYEKLLLRFTFALHILWKMDKLGAKSDMSFFRINHFNVTLHSKPNAKSSFQH